MEQYYKIDKDDFSMAGEASSSVKRTLTKLGVEPSIIKRVAIAMYEAEINAFIHGGGGEALADIRTWLAADARLVLREFSGG